MSDPVVILGLRDVLKRLRLFRYELSSKPLMAEISEYIIYQIETRTMKGVDADGNSFKPYSPQYALFREEHGRPVDKVDLNFDGIMMSAITYDAEEEETTLFFLNETDNSGTSVPLKAFFLNEEREFFAMGEEDLLGVRRIIKQYLKRLKRR